MLHRSILYMSVGSTGILAPERRTSWNLACAVSSPGFLSRDINQLGGHCCSCHCCSTWMGCYCKFPICLFDLQLRSVCRDAQGIIVSCINDLRHEGALYLVYVKIMITETDHKDKRASVQRSGGLK